MSTYNKGKERNPEVYVPTCRLMERSGISCFLKLEYILKYYNNTAVS